MIALLMAALASDPALEHAADCAAASTNVELCRREAEVTGVDPRTLCEQYRRELDNLQCVPSLMEQYEAWCHDQEEAYAPVKEKT